MNKCLVILSIVLTTKYFLFIIIYVQLLFMSIHYSDIGTECKR